MSRCNRCTLADIQRREPECAVTVTTSTKYPRMGGYDVRIDGTFVAWLAALGARCECDE